LVFAKARPAELEQTMCDETQSESSGSEDEECACESNESNERLDHRGPDDRWRFAILWDGA
jgi:hypothetical protein